MDADVRRLRIDDEAAGDARGRAAITPPSGAVACVVNVGTGSANAFCICTRQAVTGTETTGGVGALAGVGDTFEALNLGGGDPTGKTVVATYVPYRWVIRYD